METKHTKYQSIVLMGKTGSGKGTQAKLLADALEYPIFSTGDKAREIGAQDTSLGRKIREIHVSGWIPEWLASYLMVRVLLEEHPSDGLVFESVARKPLEAEKFHEIHEMVGRSYIVVHLDIEDELVIERMRKRNRDESDSEANIQNRLRAFREETVQSLEFFRSHGKVVTVDADQNPEKVFEDVLSLITV